MNMIFASWNSLLRPKIVDLVQSRNAGLSCCQCRRAKIQTHAIRSSLLLLCRSSNDFRNKWIVTKSNHIESIWIKKKSNKFTYIVAAPKSETEWRINCQQTNKTGWRHTHSRRAETHKNRLRSKSKSLRWLGFDVRMPTSARTGPSAECVDYNAVR